MSELWLVKPFTFELEYETGVQ